MKKKGFTLIELLAVIIVLAIIALIATPIIFNVIENAKLKALENSSYGVIDAVRTQYAENLLNSTDGTVTLTGEVVKLIVAGEQPIAGTWTIDNESDSDEKGIKIVGLKFASMKDYTCTNYINGKIESKVICTKDNGEVDEFQPIISAKEATIEVNKGTDEQIKNYFNVTFGKTGGNVTCEVENVSSLSAGDHTVKCTATGTNGKTVEATIKITVSDSTGNTNSLKSAILGNNNSNIITSGDGLYSQTTDNGTTYYFKGTVENNYIKFADILFRIVRINEDGTIRIITQDNVLSNKEFKNFSKDDIPYMYYTNSDVKTVADNWFNTTIIGDSANKVVNGDYFCEQPKVVPDASYFAESNVSAKDNYIPSFNCTTDGSEYGVVSGKVGLITIDEVLYAGGSFNNNSNFYLKNGSSFWTMSSAGFSEYNNSTVWSIDSAGNIDNIGTGISNGVRPVLNLNANTLITGSGTETDPYIVK